jgi:hypothetical protein
MSRKPGRPEYFEDDPDSTERFKALAQDVDHFDLVQTNYVRQQFTITCNKCKSQKITLVDEAIEDTQYTYLVCDECGNHAEVASISEGWPEESFDEDE